MRPNDFPLIVNASAGGGWDDAISARVLAAFKAGGASPRVMLAQTGAELSDMTQRALAEKADRLVAGGGDGTLNTIASRLVGTATALAILPLGTLNHFAKDLGVPIDIELAVANALNGKSTMVDVGKVNDRFFLNNSSLGLYPRVVRLREQQQQRLGRGKWPAFAWAALMVLRRYSFMAVSLETDGNRVERHTPLMFVGNNEYVMEGLGIGSRARLDGETLSLYVPRDLHRWGLVKLALRALSGSRKGDPDLDVIVTRSLVVRSRRRRLLVSVDGEVEPMAVPLRYAVCPGALRVIVPATASKA